MAISVKQLAEILDVKPYTVRKWIRAGYIKAAKLGRSYRMSVHDVNEWWKERGGGILLDKNGERAQEAA